LKQFVTKKPKAKIALLYGPAGCGKTCLVQALASDLNAELLEVNASDVRNEENINLILGNALKQQSLFAKTKIILFDEIDGLSGTDDRGGLAVAIALAKQTTFPVIMAANDPWDQKFSALRKDSVMIQARSLAYTSIVPVLKKIAIAEKLDYSEEALKTLARRTGGDMRAAIIDLQTLGSRVTEELANTLSERNPTENIFNAIRVVLKTKDPRTARQALDGVHEDLDEIMLWMDENLAKEYKKPEDLENAYRMFSQADVFRGRIRRWQHWRFLVYCYDLIGPGISLAKTEKYEGFTQLTPTQRLFAVWRSKSAKRDSIVAKLGSIGHTSKKQARTELRILKPVLKNADWLDEEEKEWLSQR
jgi:replication factor C large subunit